MDGIGNLYAGAETGEIYRFNLSSGKRETMTNTGGRPLGLHFDSLGYLVIADGEKGLLRMSPTGQLETLVNSHGGRPFRFTDDLEIAADGKIYFSDASDMYGFKKYKWDLVEHRPNGRLLVYDPATKETKLLLDKLYFANGIALPLDDSFVLVNETSQYRVRRYWLKGPKAGQSDIFMDNLPGFPDGISKGENGIFWLTLISPRNHLLDFLAPYPFVRKSILRLPPLLQPSAKRYLFVLGLDKNGEIVHNLQDPDPTSFHELSSIQQFGERLWFGSIGENCIASYKMSR